MRVNLGTRFGEPFCHGRRVLKISVRPREVPPFGVRWAPGIAKSFADLLITQSLIVELTDSLLKLIKSNATFFLPARSGRLLAIRFRCRLPLFRHFNR
jgi:hypothetical protein